jgi:hypothetical protein
LACPTGVAQPGANHQTGLSRLTGINCPTSRCVGCVRHFANINVCATVGRGNQFRPRRAAVTPNRSRTRRSFSLDPLAGRETLVVGGVGCTARRNADVKAKPGYLNPNWPQCAAIYNCILKHKTKVLGFVDVPQNCRRVASRRNDLTENLLELRRFYINP